METAATVFTTSIYLIAFNIVTKLYLDILIVALELVLYTILNDSIVHIVVEHG
jgi:hypothetical protein